MLNVWELLAFEHKCIYMGPSCESQLIDFGEKTSWEAGDFGWVEKRSSYEDQSEKLAMFATKVKPNLTHDR